MRKTIVRTLAVALLALAARAAEGPAPAPSDPFRPESILPEGTILFASLPLSKATLEALGRTAIGRIAEDEEVVQFLEKPRERLEDAFEAWRSLERERHGIDPRAFLAQIPERAVFAILKWDPKREEPSGLFFAARLAGSEADALSLIEKTLEGARGERLARSAYEHGSVRVTRLVFEPERDERASPADPGPPFGALEFAFHRGWLIGVYDEGPEGEHRADLRELLDQKKPLSGSAAFRKAAEKVGYDGADPFLFADLGQLLAVGRDRAREAGDEKSHERLMDALGASAIRSIGYCQRIEGKGLRDDIFIDAPAPRTGLLAALEGAGAKGDLARFFPADCQLYLEAAISPSKLLRALREILKASPGSEEEFEKGIARAEEAIGFSIEKELLPCLGIGAAYGGTVGVMPVGIGKTILVLELADPEKLAALIAKVRGSPAVEDMAIFVDGEEEGVRTTSITIKNVPIPFIPSYAIAEGHLLIAETAPTLSLMIAAMKGREPALAASPGFAALRSRAFDERAIFGGYYEIKAIASAVYGVLIPALGLMTASAPELRKVFEDVGIDTALLPSREAIVDPLFPGTDTMRISEEGILYSGASPLGSPPLALFKIAAGIGGTIGIVGAMREAVEEGREESCRRNLEKIRDAIAEYRSTTGGGEPPRSLIDLVRSGAIADAKILRCPSDRNPQRLIDPSKGTEIFASYRYAPEAYAAAAGEPKMVVFEPDEARHRGGSLALMSDGKVKKIWRGERIRMRQAAAPKKEP